MSISTKSDRKHSGGGRCWQRIACLLGALGVVLGGCVIADLGDESFRISVIVSGNGSLTSDPEGIDCPDTCSAFFEVSEVTLTAIADTGSEVGEWDGCDSVSGDVCTVSLTAATTVSVTFTEAEEITSLGGAADDLANDNIPDISFPDPDPDDYDTEDDALISRRTFLIIFEDTTTVAEANELLTSMEGTIIGAIPDFGVLYVQCPDMSIDETMLVFDELQDNELVAAGVMDIGGMAPQQLPPHNVTDKLWTWEIEDPPKNGNWGLKMIRAPQMWNLDTFVRRNRSTNSVCAGVVEPAPAPDTNHPDGELTFDAGSKDRNDDHATLVAGVIAANWSNNIGVEGIMPWLTRLYARPTAVIMVRATLAQITKQLNNVLSANSCVKVVNGSYGYHPNAPPSTAIMNACGTLLRTAANNWGAANRTDFMIVGSAGNGGGTANSNAQFNSGVSNAAVRFGGQFLSVEAITTSGAAWGGSDQGGSVSAPGDCVRTTEAADGTNYDSALCTWSDGIGGIAIDQNYATESGTSFATPYVTGLIAALWKLEPALTNAQIRTLITSGTYTKKTTGGTKERIDAFSAAMGIDALRGNKNMQKALVDVDDGTADGNLRKKVLDSEKDPDDIHNSGKRRGDDKVNMRDFRAFRDAFLDDPVLGAIDILLDGVDTHFKRDLNMDGCTPDGIADPKHPVDIAKPAKCDDATDEQTYSRYDFNGSGKLEFTTDELDPLAIDLAPFKIDPDTTCTMLNTPAGCIRDFDVLTDKDIWEMDSEMVTLDPSESPPCTPGVLSAPPGDWSPTSMLLDRDDDGSIDYMFSADLHIIADESDPDGGLIVHSGIDFDDSMFVKCRKDALDFGVVTVPLFGGSPVLRVDYKKTVDGETRALALRAFPAFGEDIKLVVDFEMLELSSSERGIEEGFIAREEQLESHTRDSSVADAYGEDTAATLDELEEKMFMLATELILPKSLIKTWLGDVGLLVPAWSTECIETDDSGSCTLYKGELYGALMSG